MEMKKKPTKISPLCPVNKLVALFYFRIFHHIEDKEHEREVDEMLFGRFYIKN